MRARRVSPSEQLGDDVGVIVQPSDVVDPDDVLMVERGGHPGFLYEALDALRVGCLRARQHLQRHVTTQAGVCGAVDVAHPAPRQQLRDPVRTQHRAGPEQ